MRGWAVAGVVALVLGRHAAWAGDVTAIAKAGKLALRGSAEADVVSLDAPASGVLRVTPGAATTVNGLATAVLFAATGGMTVELGSGDDSLTLDGVGVGGKLAVDMDDGFDAVTLLATEIEGAATIDLGDGAGAFAFCDGSTGKGLRIESGTAGTGIATASCPVIATTIDVTDGTAIVLGRTVVGGPLSLKTRGGAAQLFAFESGVARKTTLAFGPGSALVGFCGSTISGALRIAMAGGTDDDTLTCTRPTGTSSMQADNGLFVADTTLAGGLGFTGPEEHGSNVFLTGSDVGRDAKLTLGDGLLNSVVLSDAGIARDLVVRGGSGFDYVQAFFEPFAVGRDATFDLGEGDNTMSIVATATVGRDLAITTGDGDDTIDISGTVVAGTTTIAHGAGNDVVP